ncbi:MAG: hypothetical protein IKT40_08885 [Bacilli bacterium]|nr:hypothetical protein [Bacilli bacterium]
MGKKKKKKNKNKGVYCPSVIEKEKKKKGTLTPLEFRILCDKIKIGTNQVEIFNYY